jgi:Protein similar to CwfJ C-terminus 1
MPAHHKFRVVALGNHVVLVMAPSHETLAATVGQHLYLVPQTPVASLSTWQDAEIWKEIEQFQGSLSKVFHNDDLIYFETVLPVRQPRPCPLLLGTGYAQLIEPSSFPRDFGLDTIAGMLSADELVRCRRRHCQNDERNRQEILQFLTKTT